RRGPGARRALCRGRRLRRALGVRGVRPARARGGDARRAARGGRAAVARRDLPGCGARRGPARREPDRPRRRPRADGAGDAGGPRRGRRRARAPPLLGDHRPAHAGRARARGRPMSEEPRVDVVVVSYETRETLLECLAAFVAEPTASVVVIDNASRDGTAAAVRERFPSVRLVANAENVGFARACNQGARESRARYLLFLNPDATLAPGSLGALAAILEARPRVGVVGPRTRSANGDIQVSTGPDLSLVSEIRQRRLVRGVARRDAAILVEAEGLHAVEREVDWVSGACLMIRREAFDAVSGFDERFFLYEEDADLCRR